MATKGEAWGGEQAFEDSRGSKRTYLVEVAIRAEDGKRLVVSNSTSSGHVEVGMGGLEERWKEERTAK